MLTPLVNKMAGLCKILPLNDLNIVVFMVLITGNNSTRDNISGYSENNSVSLKVNDLESLLFPKQRMD